MWRCTVLCRPTEREKQMPRRYYKRITGIKYKMHYGENNSEKHRYYFL